VQVYVETQPLIRSVLDGYNVCIFAYGQTGSGKTHTMAGTDVVAVEGRGINYRALDDLFDMQHQRAGETYYAIKVQMLEVYNEKARAPVLLLTLDAGERVRWLWAVRWRPQSRAAPWHWSCPAAFVLQRTRCTPALACQMRRSHRL
jgi:Kinesin motor domain